MMSGQVECSRESKTLKDFIGYIKEDQILLFKFLKSMGKLWLCSSQDKTQGQDWGHD